MIALKSLLEVVGMERQLLKISHSTIGFIHQMVLSEMLNQGQEVISQIQATNVFEEKVLLQGQCTRTILAQDRTR